MGVFILTEFALTIEMLGFVWELNSMSESGSVNVNET